MLGFAADVEQAAVDLGMEGFDAAVEHFGEAGEFADVFDGEAGFAEGAGGAAGRDQFDAVAGERLGEVDEAGFVGDAEEGAADWLEGGGCGQEDDPSGCPFCLPAGEVWLGWRALFRVHGDGGGRERSLTDERARHSRDSRWCPGAVGTSHSRLLVTHPGSMSTFAMQSSTR